MYILSAACTSIHLPPLRCPSMTFDYNITKPSSCESIHNNINGQLCQGFTRKDEKNVNQHELEMREKKDVLLVNTKRHQLFSTNVKYFCCRCGIGGTVVVDHCCNYFFGNVFFLKKNAYSFCCCCC